MLKVIIADDHRMFREGLSSLLSRTPEIKVIAEAEDGYQAVKLAGRLYPDIVIMDITMKGLNGINATRQIVKKKLPIKVIILSMHSDKKFVLEAIKAGVSGYLLKESAYEELNVAIKTVAQNKFYLSPDISNAVIQDYYSNFKKEERTINNLTVKEKQTLQLIAEGNSTKEIASMLEISIKTVETYRAHIMEKLDIHSVAELTKYAIREGLTSLE